MKYPFHRKWLIWIDEETGELSNKRKSPVVGSVYSAFIELYKIKNFLVDTNLRFQLVLLDMEEYPILKESCILKSMQYDKEERFREYRKLYESILA